MTKSECGGGGAHSYSKGRAKRKEASSENKKKEANAQMNVKSESCRVPDGHSDNKDENNEAYEGNEAAPCPLLFGLAHVSDKLSTLFSGFCGFPAGRCTQGNAEYHGSKDPENWEHY